MKFIQRNSLSRYNEPFLFCKEDRMTYPERFIDSHGGGWTDLSPKYFTNFILEIML